MDVAVIASTAGAAMRIGAPSHASRAPRCGVTDKADLIRNRRLKDRPYFFNGTISFAFNGFPEARPLGLREMREVEDMMLNERSGHFEAAVCRLWPNIEPDEPRFRRLGLTNTISSHETLSPVIISLANPEYLHYSVSRQSTTPGFLDFFSHVRKHWALTLI
jgi:hypothetical protein